MDNARFEQLSVIDMRDMYNRQIGFQKSLTNEDLPFDSPLDFRDQICLMAEEFGELAKTDKRWRNFDGSGVKPTGDKLDEIADVMIVAMNLAIFSGFHYDDVLLAVGRKIDRNERKLKNNA